MDDALQQSWTFLTVCFIVKVELACTFSTKKIAVGAWITARTNVGALFLAYSLLASRTPFSIRAPKGCNYKFTLGPSFTNWALGARASGDRTSIDSDHLCNLSRNGVGNEKGKDEKELVDDLCHGGVGICTGAFG
mmetsp:Transcript_2010/g.2814  ORF Transcript_2010/g.2814 Transcript_2010/m.2814 type:complete len:135 (+) Transcript_2010:179-583(+)